MEMPGVEKNIGVGTIIRKCIPPAAGEGLGRFKLVGPTVQRSRVALMSRKRHVNTLILCLDAHLCLIDFDHTPSTNA